MATTGSELDALKYSTYQRILSERQYRSQLGMQQSMYTNQMLGAMSPGSVVQFNDLSMVNMTYDVAPPAPPPNKRTIERLRDEITSWHGNVLERNK